MLDLFLSEHILLNYFYYGLINCLELFFEYFFGRK